MGEVENEIRRKLKVNSTEEFHIEDDAIMDLKVEYIGESRNYDLTIGKHYNVLGASKVEGEPCFIILFNDSNKYKRYSSELFKLYLEDEDDEPKSFTKKISGIKPKKILCDCCKKEHYSEAIKVVGKENVCFNCLKEETINPKHTCGLCKKTYFKETLKTIEGMYVCKNCFDNQEKLLKSCPICLDKFLPKPNCQSIEDKEQMCSKCSTNSRHQQFSDLFLNSEDRFFKIGMNETTFNKIGQRTFGVEFEMESKEYLRQSARNVAKELNNIYIDSKHTAMDYIRAKRDGSLHPNFGIEIITTILRGDKGVEILDKLTSSFKKHFDTSARCGLHIHISVEDFDDKELIDLYYVYQQIQPILKYYVSPHRLRNKYCRRIPKQKKEVFEKVKEKTITRTFDNLDIAKDKKMGEFHCAEHYDSINFSSVRAHGTLEIRLMEGNLDFEKIYEWIKLHMRVIDWVKAQDSKSLYSRKISLKEIIGDDLFESMLEKKKKFLLNNKKVVTTLEDDDDVETYSEDD